MTRDASSPGGIEDFDFGTPQRGTKEGYLTTFFNNRMHVAHLITQYQGISDIRIQIMTMYLISTITDDTERKKLSDAFQSDLEAVEGEKTAEKRALKANRVCMEYMGKVSSWYDEFLGITHRLTFGMGGIPFWLKPGGEEKDESEY